MRRLWCWLRLGHRPVRVLDKIMLREVHPSTGASFSILDSHTECRTCGKRLR